MVKNLTLYEMIFGSGLVVKMVLAILFVLSILSWAIILAKIRRFSKIRKDREKFLKILGAKDIKGIFSFAKLYKTLPQARLFVSCFRLKRVCGEKELSYGEAKRRLNDEIDRLYQSLTFLATVGNMSPFIGLFGTVWGIMDAFRRIGVHGSASLSIVGPGISEALITTAFGLFCAIPAVWAYNYFLDVAQRLERDLKEDFRQIFLKLKTQKTKESHVKEILSGQ